MIKYPMVTGATEYREICMLCYHNAYLTTFGKIMLALSLWNKEKNLRNS